ncbi:hypothetical protein VTN31DRAFT_2174 [Thermomyces dupontii]|uniref:uncharacterized protein n=1 Tax=Talaromyces thermophilus TaxID=28565 RepID=UPI0037436425
MKLLAILAVVPLCLGAKNPNITDVVQLPGSWIELVDNCRLHVHNWGGDKDRCNATSPPLGESNGKTCRATNGSTVSPEVTLCHKYQTVKMAFEGPKRGFADFTLKSFSRVATNQSMFAFSFPVGTEVGCRTYVGDDYNQIFVRRGCTVDSGKYEGEIAWYDLG